MCLCHDGTGICARSLDLLGAIPWAKKPRALAALIRPWVAGSLRRHALAPATAAGGEPAELCICLSEYNGTWRPLKNPQKWFSKAARKFVKLTVSLNGASKQEHPCWIGITPECVETYWRGSVVTASMRGCIMFFIQARWPQDTACGLMTNRMLAF